MKWALRGSRFRFEASGGPLWRSARLRRASDCTNNIDYLNAFHGMFRAALPPSPFPRPPSTLSSASHLAGPLRDQPRGALVADVIPEPADGDAEPVAQTDQEVDVGDAPDPPGDGAAQFDRSEIDHRLAFADLGKTSGVMVAEWRRRFAPQARFDRCSDVAALLLGRRCNAGHRLSIRARNADGIADREDVGMARHGQIRQDLQSAGAVSGRAQPFCGARGAHAGGPDQGPRLQPLAVIDHAVGRTL